jgi:predicted transcriptional regulator
VQIKQMFCSSFIKRLPVQQSAKVVVKICKNLSNKMHQKFKTVATEKCKAEMIDFFPEMKSNNFNSLSV